MVRKWAKDYVVTKWRSKDLSEQQEMRQRNWITKEGDSCQWHSVMGNQPWFEVLLQKENQFLQLEEEEK